MSRNFIDLERDLIEDLERRTGRTLAQWMVAIDAANLDDKNAVIDWLRPQGFTFANASWLERIHNNGGRPIYLDQPEHLHGARSTGQLPPCPPAPVSAAPKPVQPKPPMQPPARPPARPVAAPPPPDTSAIASILAQGKAYRPLAEMLLREIERALPDVTAAPEEGLIGLFRPHRLGVLQITPKELRLGLILGDTPLAPPYIRARIPGANSQITHMIVLNDARQISSALMADIELAAECARSAQPNA